jgi:hypothetical protein
MTTALTIKARDVRCFATSDERLTTGGWEMALIGGYHRDSTALDVANAQELLARLKVADPRGRYHDTMRASHWAVGWYEHLIVNPRSKRVMAVLREAKEQLEGYPVLSDDRLSAVEAEWHFDERCGEDCPFDHDTASEEH